MHLPARDRSLNLAFPPPPPRQRCAVSATHALPSPHQHFGAVHAAHAAASNLVFVVELVDGVEVLLPLEEHIVQVAAVRPAALAIRNEASGMRNRATVLEALEE